jgi:archaetidylinositol phosphate synthase
MDKPSDIRVNDILLGPLERPAIRWLTAHMPAWVTPDTLTLTGVLGSVAAFCGYVLTWYDDRFLWLASAGFVINWFGDSLDGGLARYRRIERPRYGYFIDHTADSISMLLVFLGLGLSPHMRLDLACLGLVGYLLMGSLVYIRTNVDKTFRLSYGKIGPTEMRAAIVLVNTLMLCFGNPVVVRLSADALRALDLFGALIALGLIATFCINSLVLARRFARIDRPGGTP